MRTLAAFALIALPALLLTGCPEAKKKAAEIRNEVADDVGGAPKQQIQNATKRAVSAAAKNAARLNAAEAVGDE